MTRNLSRTLVARRRLMAGVAALSGASPAMAQGDFPARPITLVVPFPPGGQADLASRPVAGALERILRQPVIVQNRAGAGGAIATAFVARAPADGHTLLMSLSTLAAIPESERLFNRAPPYEVNQLVPIARVLSDAPILVVRADSPWRTAQEFVAAARARPGDITYGSGGNYATLHLPMVMLEQAANAPMLHVPFQGGGPAVTAVLAGQVQAAAAAPGLVLQHVEGGRLRALASWGRDRSPAFPQLPTLRELGWESAEFYNWAGVFAPAATPAPIRARLDAAIAEAMAQPELNRAYEAAGSRGAHLNADAFAGFLADDTPRIVAAVRRIGRVE
ncbi:MAG: tripartite tricarboxylate transporter substrate binding protein [Acetobacteraceae bacterium]|nr:tripartite tricarboxylate transporter substrate binding protein [Acetobacteraceae bacterium]